jgi:hypothetical protein
MGVEGLRCGSPTDSSHRVGPLLWRASSARLTGGSTRPLFTSIP